MKSPTRVANRRNAIRSTGPLTVAGKIRASNNAIKHGLSTSIRDDPKIPSMIEALALAITGSNPKPRKLQAACDVAETYLEHRRLQEFKLALIWTEAASMRAARNQSGKALNGKEQLLDDNVRAYIRTLPLLSLASNATKAELNLARCGHSAHTLLHAKRASDDCDREAIKPVLVYTKPNSKVCLFANRRYLSGRVGKLYAVADNSTRWTISRNSGRCAREIPHRRRRHFPDHVRLRALARLRKHAPALATTRRSRSESRLIYMFMKNSDGEIGPSNRHPTGIHHAHEFMHETELALLIKDRRV